MTGTAGLSLADGSMMICVSAVTGEVSAASWTGSDVMPASGASWTGRDVMPASGASPEELCRRTGVCRSPYSLEERSTTAHRKDLLLSLALLLTQASSFCLALCTQLVCGARGLLRLTTVTAGTGGRTRGFGLSAGLIPAVLALANAPSPAPGWRKLTLVSAEREELPSEAGLIWLMISDFPRRKIQLGNSVSHLVSAVLISILSEDLQSVVSSWEAL